MSPLPKVVDAYYSAYLGQHASFRYEFLSLRTKCAITNNDLPKGFTLLARNPAHPQGIEVNTTAIDKKQKPLWGWSWIAVGADTQGEKLLFAVGARFYNSQNTADESWNIVHYYKALNFFAMRFIYEGVAIEEEPWKAVEHAEVSLAHAIRIGFLSPEFFDRIAEVCRQQDK